jgi:hypothetical protein
MTRLETKLVVALRANSRLREQAERLLAPYIVPDPDEAAALFDGRQQREAPRPQQRRWMARKFGT